MAQEGRHIGGSSYSIRKGQSKVPVGIGEVISLCCRRLRRKGTRGA